MSTVDGPAEHRHLDSLRRAPDWWRRLGYWWSLQWTPLAGPGAKRGARWAILVLLTLFVAIRLIFLPSGHGLAFDAALVTLATATVVAVTALLVVVMVAAIRRLRPVGTGVLVGACLLLTFGLFSTPAPSVALAIISVCLAAVVLGSTIGTVVSGRIAGSSLVAKVMTLGLLVTAAAYVVGFSWTLAGDGDMEKISSWRPRAEWMPPNLSAPDPGANGPYTVRTLFYGSGNDVRRSEYNDGVAIRTRPVDASPFFPGYAGWGRWARSRFWGFDLDKLPLNARVWYPDGSGPFPLALIVHGNHRMNEFSDAGYEYLGQLLASRGFILASVDQNFLNGTSGFSSAPALPSGREQAVRGWLLLEHLRLWHEWNADPASPFYGKLDVARIALMGHSRGGEAAATAAAFNRMKYYPDDARLSFSYGYAVEAVVAIAPVDGQYQPAQQLRRLEDVSYLTLQGSHDASVTSFEGSRQADRVSFTRPGPWFTTEIWAHRANHNQFSTARGRVDFSGPLGWFLNVRPLMSGDEQRQISKAYISAFLETTLNGRREYLPLFQDWRKGRRWLPDTVYVNRYRDAAFVPLATFQEDADLTTTTAAGGAIDGHGLTLWREGRIPSRVGNRGYNGVFLGWYQSEGRAPAVYSLSLPKPTARTWRLTDRSTVELSVAVLDQNAPAPPGVRGRQAGGTVDREAPDFTIELVSDDGTSVATPLSRVGEIQPPLKQKFTKFGWVEQDRYGRDWEPVFQTIRAPLATFGGSRGRALDPGRLVAVRLKFDRTRSSVICIGAIGFGSE